ncbi:MAG TPA: YraN family protein [Casimicrobiaceae bacterium]|nr:YraN family protein [Casimicrobiaceae bacterium]
MHTLAARARGARGNAAERMAERFLAGHGVVTIARNFRTRRGEIDLIARDGGTLVFVEVRLRARNDYGGAAASITTAKQQRLVAAASQYLATWRGALPSCRFDAVLLDALDPTRIEWLQDVITL